MKNNKGFTLVEIIVTFTLISTISFLLFQLILSLKNIYTSSDYKTVLLIEQGNMSRRINTDLFTMPFVSLNECSKSDAKGLKKCYLFTLEDTILEQEVIKKLEIYNDKIIYDGFQMNVGDGSKMGDVSAVVSYIEDASVKYNSILTIDIPITNKLTEGDFGVSFSVQYNSITGKIPVEILDDYHKIEIVTTTVSDIIGKTTLSGDGLYAVNEEEWYNSKDKDQLRYIYKGEMPNNFVIYNKICYRIIGITNDKTVKMIYESEADEGRCNIVNTSGEIGIEAWGHEKDNNFWLSTNSTIRNLTLPDWLNTTYTNTSRISGGSNFFYGALTAGTEESTRVDIMNEQKTNRGSSSLPERVSYTDNGALAGLPMVSDYIFASLDSNCTTMYSATSSTSCKNANYLHKDYDFWTLNASANGVNTVWAVTESGMLEEREITSKLFVRPVIFLKESTKFSGGGTAGNPYVVK